jgi:RND superfamily putative drug exporter
MPIPTNRSGDTADAAEPTTALPVMRTDGDDSGTATEQLNSRAQGENGDNPRQRRRGGGAGGAPVSAQDLLRREGRL